ncbi:MAG: hypothetical protein JXA37_09080 [Chloroflexia bacterium]|nr:hypothetical protein [Chloroflexia bacterium]
MRSWAEIDQRLFQGQAAVLTAAEAQELIRERGLEEAARRVDVVVTATFVPACWAMLFFRPTAPSVAHWVEQAWLAGVPLLQGFQPQEFVLEASASGPRQLRRGGAHLMEAWLAGERLSLRLQLRPVSPTTPGSWEHALGLADLQQARLLVVQRSLARGCLATNSQAEALPSELGILLPGMGNAASVWMGPWEPAVLDPHGRIIRPGLPVLLAGEVGHVVWRQTETIAVSTDLSLARREYLRALSIPGYAVGLAVGVAWPIAVLDAALLAPLQNPEKDLPADVLDYGSAQRPFPRLATLSYGQIQGDTIDVDGRNVPLTTLSSRSRAARLAEELKQRLLRREFPPLAPPAAAPTETG